MNLDFTHQAWEDYAYWQQHDKKTLKKLNVLIKDILRHPYEGIGKPEALKGDLSGFWSRRIDGKHRIIYRIVADRCQIVQCKGHYGDG